VTTNTFWYVLGWAADKHGIHLHAAVALSNHVHLHLTDPAGVYPDFLRDFLCLLGRAMNAHRGRWEHFWDSNQASVVRLEDQAAQIDKLLYVLGNPVGLVEKAGEWPGATSLDATIAGKPIVATRPEHFFRDKKAGGEMPERVVVNFVPPPGLAQLSREDYVRVVRDGIARVEAEAAEERRKTSRGVLGRARILAQHWNDRPAGAEPRRELSPAVACRDKWLRIERLAQNKVFQHLYRKAFEAFRLGMEAIFPFATWLMRFRASINVSTA
jgi:hypothetical protein